MHLLRYSDMRVSGPLIIPIRVKGLLKLEAINKFSGRKRILADWFPNKVLDAGRNYIGDFGSWLNHCQVGTDNTTPTAGDTTLGGYIAGTSTVQSNTASAQASSPYYGYRRKTFRFGVGQTAANLSEAGVGWSSAEGAFLFTRALIVDGTGTPTTVTPLADEILDVTYELRYYSPTADVTGTINLDGVTYDTTIRASLANSGTYWGSVIGLEVGPYTVGGSSEWAAFDGNIGTVIQAPSGTSANLDGTPAALAYGNNNYYRDLIASCGVNGWNLTGGIRSVGMATSLGAFQTEFAAQSGGGKVPKDNLKTMSLTWRLAWVEGTIP